MSHIQEFISETEVWRNKLKILEEETIRFKLLLAHMLLNGLHKDQLEYPEYFQNRFLKIDERISLLRHEVLEHQHLLQEIEKEHSPNHSNLADQHKDLGIKIGHIKENFDKLSQEFASYASGNMTA